MAIIRSVARNAYRGDQVRIMTCVHQDVRGYEWPKGTEYTPLSMGIDNTMSGARDVQIVSIAGDGEVRFAGRRNANVGGFR